MMTTPRKKEDIPLAAYNRVRSAMTSYNDHLLHLTSTWEKYAFHLIGGGFFVFWGIRFDQGKMILTVFFFCGAAIALFLTKPVPYNHSPEYIFYNPVWTAVKASFHHKNPISLEPMKDENNDFWKVLTKKRSHFWDKVTLEAATNDLAVHAIAELDRISFKKNHDLTVKENFALKVEIEELRKEFRSLEEKVKAIPGSIKK